MKFRVLYSRIVENHLSNEVREILAGNKPDQLSSEAKILVSSDHSFKDSSVLLYSIFWTIAKEGYFTVKIKTDFEIEIYPVYNASDKISAIVIHSVSLFKERYQELIPKIPFDKFLINQHKQLRLLVAGKEKHLHDLIVHHSSIGSN